MKRVSHFIKSDAELHGIPENSESANAHRRNLFGILKEIWKGNSDRISSEVLKDIPEAIRNIGQDFTEIEYQAAELPFIKDEEPHIMYEGIAFKISEIDSIFDYAPASKMVEKEEL
jgi:hypothetical protein